jgi:hypothetical protein
MSLDNQPIEVEKSRLQPGGDITNANAAVRLMTTTGVPEITSTFEEGGASYVTISVLGGAVANAYQLVPATPEEQSQKWPTRDGYENRFVTRGGVLHRLQGPPRRFKAREDAPAAPPLDGSHGARADASPAAEEEAEEAARPAPTAAAATGPVGQTEATGGPDAGERAAEDDVGERAVEDEGEEEGDGESGEDEGAGGETEAGPTGGAKTQAPASAGAGAATKADAKKKEEPPRSYVWEEIPARLILHLRPNDGHELGREIWITGVTYDGDVPKAAVVREKELGVLPPPVAGVLQSLKDSLPELREAHEAGLRAEAEKKRAEEERKLKDKIKSKHKAGKSANKSTASSTGAQSKPAAPSRPASQATSAPLAQVQSPTPQEAAHAPDHAAADAASDEAVLNDDRPVIEANGDARPEPKPPAAATTAQTRPRTPPRKPAPPADSSQGSLF